MIEPGKTPKPGFATPCKKELSKPEGTEMTLSDKRRLAQRASAASRREKIQDTLADKLQKISDSITDDEIKSAGFKDKATAVGILYDKLYRDQRALPNTAVQVNIQTMGQDPAKVEPLMIDVTPKKDNGDK